MYGAGWVEARRELRCGGVVKIDAPREEGYALMAALEPVIQAAEGEPEEPQG